MRTQYIRQWLGKCATCWFNSNVLNFNEDVNSSAVWVIRFQTMLWCHINLTDTTYYVVSISGETLPVWRLTGCLHCTQWLMDTHNLSSLLGTDSLGLNQKCLLHYKDGYSPLGGRSERNITQPHTAGIRTNMLFKWQQSAGLSSTSREMGERKKKTATCDIHKRQENRCLSNLLLNGVRLQIVHSLLHPISRFVTHNF